MLLELIAPVLSMSLRPSPTLADGDTALSAAVVISFAQAHYTIPP